ncbi:hypothetical protein [Nonomuraea turcica]|uniref:hypothetical protein n=1 Tax=Nonomuraea sp. G32 TaxID=3067274 RepID=UPI00273ABF70|nr:hypothetical protein [Nonomuraea sp. G32]MDP4511795.1 hypothetical protein [Nonomuraea sp. G32]
MRGLTPGFRQVELVRLDDLASVVSLLVSVPINNDRLDWSAQNPPADWASVRDEEQIAHVVRTAVATLAFGYLNAAAMVKPSIPTRKEQGKA